MAYQVGWWLGQAQDEREEVSGEFEDLAEAITSLKDMMPLMRHESEDEPYGKPCVRVGRVRVFWGAGDEVKAVVSMPLFTEAEIEFMRNDKSADSWVWGYAIEASAEAAATKAVEMAGLVERKLNDHATRQSQDG